MYSCVPPPDQRTSAGVPEAPPGQRTSAGVSEEKGTKESLSQPANISQEQWERFQKLRCRRIEVCSKGRKQRVNALRNKALDTVRKFTTPLDKELLAKEGVSLPVVSRKRRRDGSHDQLPGVKASTSGASSSSQGWQELRKYLDPNPQLKSCDEGKLTEKSGLERALDTAVLRGELDEATAISDRMADRELASKIATAFDCVEYVKKQKVEKEKKKKRKSAKYKWSFELKKRWETKGNM